MVPILVAFVERRLPRAILSLIIDAAGILMSLTLICALPSSLLGVQSVLEYVNILSYDTYCESFSATEGPSPPTLSYVFMVVASVDLLLWVIYYSVSCWYRTSNLCFGCILPYRSVLANSNDSATTYRSARMQNGRHVLIEMCYDTDVTDADKGVGDREGRNVANDETEGIGKKHVGNDEGEIDNKITREGDVSTKKVRGDNTQSVEIQMSSKSLKHDRRHQKGAEDRKRKKKLKKQRKMKNMNKKSKSRDDHWGERKRPHCCVTPTRGIIRLVRMLSIIRCLIQSAMAVLMFLMAWYWPSTWSPSSIDAWVVRLTLCILGLLFLGEASMSKRGVDTYVVLNAL